MAELNALSAGDFVRVTGSVFENSPWIAQEAARLRPFPGSAGMLFAMCEVVRKAPDDQQLALIRAHPDLAGRLALTAESSSEQAAAGLNSLTPGETALFQRQNDAYRRKFGFPFVICARLNNKDAILDGFARRLQNSREQEIRAALEEIFKIAGLRLGDLIVE
ncbi:MAG: 2-oxo-4-hydroxy-4-carboxy-5-ureidoimidazoline decarboxylase [Verrucomicrobiota bacterium]